MQEKNLERVKEICATLSAYRAKIDAINETKEFRNATIRIKYFNKQRKDFSVEDMSIINLGDEILRFILKQERLRLQGRIIELEAEIKNL